jgi:hypothetical protein
MVIWYIYFFPFLVFCAKKNLATLTHITDRQRGQAGPISPRKNNWTYRRCAGADLMKLNFGRKVFRLIFTHVLICYELANSFVISDESMKCISVSDESTNWRDAICTSLPDHLSTYVAVSCCPGGHGPSWRMPDHGLHKNIVIFLRLRNRRSLVRSSCVKKIMRTNVCSSLCYRYCQQCNSQLMYINRYVFFEV